MVGALLDELRRERHEDEPREHDVRRGRIPRTGEELRRVLGGNGELEARALAEDGEREALADELARDDDAEVERRGTLLASHAPVVGDRHAIDRREDVADAEHGVEVADLGDVLHEDARGRRREEDEAPQRLILERLKGRRKSGEAAERRRRGAAGNGDGATVAAAGGKRPARRGDGIKVLEHALEDPHWHNLAHVLSLHRRLERDADDVAVAHRRPAAVPVVDGRVDRHDEVRLAALRVHGPIYARDDAARDRETLLPPMGKPTTSTCCWRRGVSPSGSSIASSQKASLATVTIARSVWCETARICATCLSKSPSLRTCSVEANATTCAFVMMSRRHVEMTKPLPVDASGVARDHGRCQSFQTEFVKHCTMPLSCELIVAYSSSRSGRENVEVRESIGAGGGPAGASPSRWLGLREGARASSEKSMDGRQIDAWVRALRKQV